MAANIDGKQIVNMLYHAGVESLLILGYSELISKIFKRQAPRLNLNMTDMSMVVLDVMLAMSTRDMLIKQGIIPADIMK